MYLSAFGISYKVALFEFSVCGIAHCSFDLLNDCCNPLFFILEIYLHVFADNVMNFTFWTSVFIVFVLIKWSGWHFIITCSCHAPRSPGAC